MSEGTGRDMDGMFSRQPTYRSGGKSRDPPDRLSPRARWHQCGDYAGVAMAVGAKGMHVDEVAGIAPALEQAKRANDEGEVVVIEVATRQDTRFSRYNELL